MTSNLLEIKRTGAQSPIGILFQQLAKYVLRLPTHIQWQKHRLTEDLPKKKLRVLLLGHAAFRREWQSSNKHFVQQNSHCPPVNGSRVSCAHAILFFGQDLRCQVFKSATEGARLASAVHVHFTQAKVGQFDVTLTIKEHILQLDVPVDDVVLVKVADGIADFGTVELGLGLAELFLACQMEEELTAVHVLHDQTQAIRRLE